MTTEFDKVFGDMMQPDYPSTCDQCGAEGTNASMKRHVCALRAEEWRVFEHSCKRILDANGILVAEAQTEEQAEQIVSEHNAHRKLVEALMNIHHAFETGVDARSRWAHKVRAALRLVEEIQ